MGCRSRTPRNATSGYTATCRSITGAGNTQPSEAGHLSSGSTSCSADQRGETQHVGLSPLQGTRRRCNQACRTSRTVNCKDLVAAPQKGAKLEMHKNKL